VCSFRPRNFQKVQLRPINYKMTYARSLRANTNRVHISHSIMVYARCRYSKCNVIKSLEFHRVAYRNSAMRTSAHHTSVTISRTAIPTPTPPPRRRRRRFNSIDLCLRVSRRMYTDMLAIYVSVKQYCTIIA